MVTQDTNLQLMYYSQANTGLPWLCFTALETGSTFAMVRNNGTAVPAVLELSRIRRQARLLRPVRQHQRHDQHTVLRQRRYDRWCAGLQLERTFLTP